MKLRVVFKFLLRRFPGIYRTWNHSILIRALISHRLVGSPVPPPHPVKLYWLNHFRKSYSLKTLIETGTYQGTTVATMLNYFQQIYTIELDYKLWEGTRDKFLKYPHVHVVRGDSGEVLPTILASIFDRCLFWLDGHFSGTGTVRGAKETPIVEELAAIRSHHRKDHIILIDDARLFTGRNDYPTLDGVHSLLKEINPNYTVKVVDDIIRAYLPKRHPIEVVKWI